MDYTPPGSVVADDEERARLIAARAQRFLLDGDETMAAYCFPCCPYCAVEAAREQLDEEHGWAKTTESCALSEAAMRTAVASLRNTGVYDRAR